MRGEVGVLGVIVGVLVGGPVVVLAAVKEESPCDGRFTLFEFSSFYRWGICL